MVQPIILSKYLFFYFHAHSVVTNIFIALTDNCDQITFSIIKFTFIQLPGKDIDVKKFSKDWFQI